MTDFSTAADLALAASWELLQRPFTPDQINKLPKGKGSGEDIQCQVCGGRHKERGIFHVDYVGHAHITERLNEVDPAWVFHVGPIVIEIDEDGKGEASMECSLTVLGMTRWDVGCADTGKAEWRKMLYSDCLTRCAMRFGVALDLWKKKGGSGEDSYDRIRSTPANRAAARVDARAGTVPAVKVLLDGLRASVAQLGEGGVSEWEDFRAEFGWDEKWKAGTLVDDRELVESAVRFVNEVLANERGAAGEEPWDGAEYG